MTFEFLPWLRLGLANLIQEQDDGSEGAHTRASLELALGVRAGNALEELRRTLRLLGAGDVLGVHPDALARRSPSPNLSGHKPHDLVFIEFTEADFPWRYTPAAPSGDRLRPWLALLVLEAGELELQEGGPLPVAQVVSAAALAQDLSESAAWAHVQVNAALPEDPDEAADALRALHTSAPEAFTARLLSPRRLRPHQRYTALLVPAFESGRLAGLGEDNADVPALKPAWSPGDSERRLPVYHRWSFETGEDEDFETLARRLRGHAVSQAARPKVDLGEAAAQLGVSLSAPLSVERRSALKPPGETPGDFSHGPMRQALAQETAHDAALRLSDLPAGADPLVDLPPLHGGWHADQSAADAAAPPAQAGWLEQLNLDPTWRAVAGLGAALVHEHQERFMEEAWAQYDAVHEANLTLARMQLGAEAGSAVQAKHLGALGDAEQLQVLSPLHRQVSLGGATLPEAVAPTPLPQAGFDPALSKLTRRGGRSTRALRGQLDAFVAERQADTEAANHLSQAQIDWLGGQLERGVVLTQLADNQSSVQRLVQAAVPVNAGDTATLSTTALSDAAPPSASGLVRAVEACNQQDLARAAFEGRADFQQTQPAAQAAQVALDPARRIGRAAQARFTQLGADVVDSDTGAPKPVMAAPHIDEPVYRLLLQQDLSLILPGVADVPPDSVSLLAVDQAFVEALLAGMNHAMGAELVWREFPTDRRGSVFRRFWGGAELADIEALTDWSPSSRLGSHATPARRDLTALVIRGGVVRAFDDLDVYAQRAAWHPQSAPLDDPRPRLLATPNAQNLRAPLFRADCGGDLLILGFDLSPSQLRGGVSDPGWFLNLRERSQRLRFGLDPLAHDSAPRLTSGELSWVNLQADDLSWEHLKVEPLGYASLNGVDRAVGDGSASWTFGPGASAADLAALLLRMPAMVGIHATDLLP